MKKKKLIICGDSWTDPNFKSLIDPTHVVDYDNWAVILNDKFNNQYDIVNTARSGDGNESIFSNAVEEIIKNGEDTGLVIVTLSEGSRWGIGDYRECYAEYLWRIIYSIENDGKKFEELIPEGSETAFVYKMFLSSERYESIQHHTKKLLSNILQFQEFCKSRGVNYIIVPFLNLYDEGVRNRLALRTKLQTKWITENISTSLVRSPLFDEIDCDKIYGWPYSSLLGGTIMDKQLNNTTHRVGNGDFHPNREGHKIVADTIYDFIQNKKIIG